MSMMHLPSSPDFPEEEKMIAFDFDDKIANCIVCDSQNIRDHLVDHCGITISRCHQCGFQFMNPQYSDKYLTEFYAQYLDDDDYDYWHEPLMIRHDFYLSLVEKHIKPGKVLDIGCGYGHLMEAARKRGWSIHGYDVDQVSTQKVSDRLGVEVAHGDFHSCDLGDGYDLVAMHQVLEHLKEPNKYLEKIHTLLNDGGILFVAVPNIKSLSNRLKFDLEKMGLRRKNIGKYYDTSHHVLYFEPSTLTTLLGNHGFKVAYQRNCLSARTGQTKLKRFVMKNLTDHLFAKSTFLVIARKI
jgi:2-polyprenyl-3-methyl-5-hydroxy-6-metoxy-1,4-benzoquinol methylase